MQAFHGALGTTVQTKAFTVDNADAVVVHLRQGTGPIFFTVDGAEPSLSGANSYVVHAMLGVRSVSIPTSDSQTVKLIAESAVTYSVEVL